MDNKEQVAFMPFNGINQFMVPDYRHRVIQSVFSNLEQLPPGHKTAISSMVKKYFRLPGFRNPGSAPLSIKIRGAVGPFEKNGEFAAALLAAWAELNSGLMHEVFHMLKERGWELLPLDADRTKVPGFLTRWPAEETYEALNVDFTKRYPESQASEDDVRLMAVWVSGRLPFEKVEKDTQA